MSDLFENEPKRPPPKLVSASQGRMISLAGLVERVVARFVHEHGEESADLEAADTDVKRRKLVKDVADYVFAIESVQLSPSDQASVIQQVYGELFTYGPLDALFADETITTISLDGADGASVRRKPGGELVALEPLFDDVHHLKRILNRVLTDAHAEIRDDEPTIEVGMRYRGRPININVVAPPYAPELTADIRLHPAKLPTLQDWVEAGYMTEECTVVLEAIAKSDHGFVIVGDTESGKTTLLSTLSQFIPNAENAISVEWSGELRLPDDTEQLVAKWAYGNQGRVMPETLVHRALEQEPDCILLDEVRADMQYTIMPLLEREDTPRQIWTFRGSSEVKRIRVALGMLARRANPQAPEETVNALYQKLPFVVVVKRRRGRIEVHEVAEWQYPDGAEYPDWVPLMEKGWEGLEPTQNRPVLPLGIPDSFWAN